VLSQAARALGFAFSPDGRSVLVGFGESGDRGERPDRGAFGIYKADMETLVFTRISAASVTCLTWTPVGLYACSWPGSGEFIVGFRKDVDFTVRDSQPFRALLRGAEVTGPLVATSTTTPEGCSAEWQGAPGTLNGACRLFDRCSGSSGAANPSNGCSNPGGQGGQGASGGGGQAGAGTGPPRTPGSSGPCGCHLPPQADAHGPWGLVAALAALARLRQRSSSASA
jgi:hypothetical protein